MTSYGSNIKSMKFVLIFGPGAVGKMTVGQELAKCTGLKLFHNHMSIELAYNFFEFGTKPFNRLVTLFREEIFKEVANSDLPGMIFTFVWALDEPKETEYIDRFINIFKAKGADIYYVELEADLEERLQRNRHEHRLQHKSSKREVERSEKVLLHEEENYRCNSLEGEFTRPNYLKIDNTNLSAAAVAEQIQVHFSL